MRCGGGLSHFDYCHLTHDVPVLSTIMDTTTPTPKYGICTPLVSALCYFHQRSHLVSTRYDLRVLFEKAHGEFSVNVQAISRVRHVCFLFPP